MPHPFRSIKYLFLFSCALCFSATAGAQAPAPAVGATLNTFEAVKSRIGDCAAIGDSIVRLQCYEKIAEETGFSQQEKQRQVVNTYGFWRASTRPDSTGETAFYLNLPVDQPLVMGSGVKKSPELVLRCKPKTTDVYIDWKSPVVANSNRVKNLYVSYRIDGEAPQNGDWEVSLDKSALFYSQPVEFVRALKTKKKMVAMLTPDGESLMTLSFTLTGLDSALGFIIDHCYK